MKIFLADQHDCQDLIRKFVHNYIFVKRKVLSIPTGSLIKCDCGKVFRRDQDVRGEEFWQEGPWEWVD